MGWRAAFTAAAAASQRGASGGLLQCVPAAAGLSEVERVPSVMHEGRVRILHSHGLTPLGFLWVNMYLHHSERLSKKNWAILTDVGQVVKAV
eukprot:3035800-Pyramimonas_sp.AAC.1